MMVIEKQEMPLQTDEDDVIRIEGTRVTLDTVIYAFNDGATAEEIAQQYPAISLGAVYFAIGYYLAHREQVDEYLSRAEEQAEQIKRENQARFDTTDLRERLLARRNQKG